MSSFKQGGEKTVAAVLLAMAMMLLGMPCAALAASARYDVARDADLGVVLRYEMVADRAGSSLAQVRLRDDWQYVAGRSPAFGFTQGAWWLRLRLANSGPLAKQVVLDLRTPLQDHVSWFVLHHRSGGVVAEAAAGDRRIFDFRYQKSYTLSLPLAVGPGEDLVVYAKLSSHDGFIEPMPMTLIAAEDFLLEKSKDKLLTGAYFGSLLAVCVCSFLLFLLTRETTYLLYAGFVLFLVCTILVYYGVSAEIFFPQDPDLNNQALLISFALAAVFFFLLSRHLLKLPATSPKPLGRLYDALTWLLVATVPLALVAGYAFPYAAIAILILLNIALLTYLSIRLCLKKQTEAILFSTAFLPLGLAQSLKLLSIGSIVHNQFLLERDFFLAQATMFAVAALGFAIANSIKTMRAAMLEARARELESAIALKDNELKMLHMARVNLAGELTGAIAHELSQPLTSILSNAQAAEFLIKDRHFDPATHMGIVLDIIHQARMASAVIAKIRRLLTPGLHPVEKIEAWQLVLTAKKLLQHDLSQARVRLTEQAEGGLHVKGDAVQIQQVIANLLMNAIDAVRELPENRRSVHISIRRDRGAYALFSVADTGIGLPSHCHDEIFSSFFTTKQGGLGLGLNICKKIVTAHGGAISARSAHPVGAIVEFTIPIDGSS